MYTIWEIYINIIDNDKPTLAEIYFQLLQDRQSLTKTSTINLTLNIWHPSFLTSIEMHCYFFDQGLPIMEPTSYHHNIYAPTSPLWIILLSANSPKAQVGSTV